jgi:hypothetical protein
MILRNPPTRVSRRALKSLFVKLDSATWDYLFDVEKKNGLHAHRVKGPDQLHAFYNVDGVMTWLVEMGYYTPSEFEKPQHEPALGSWAGLQIRTHALHG